MFMIFYVYAVTLPLFVQESMQVRQDQMGLVTTVFMIASMFCRPFAGKWMDGAQRRLVIPLSGLMLTISTLLYFLINDYSLFLILRFVNGAAFGIMSTAIGVIVARIVPENRRGEGLGYYSLALSLAAVFGPFIGLIVYQHGSQSIVFGMSVVFSLLAWLSAASISLPDPIEAKKNEVSLGAKSSFRWSSLFYAGAIPISLAGVLLSFSYSAVTNFIPAYTKESGFGAYTSIFFIVLSIVMVVLRPLSGKMFDRFGENVIIYPCLILFSTGLFLLFMAGSFEVFLTAGAIIGMGFGALLPAFQVIAIQSAPDRQKGTAMSTYSVFHDFGYAAGSYVLGLVAAYTGYRTMYAGDAVIVLIAAGVYYLFHHCKQRVRRSVQAYRHPE